jgi:hypothetical protein
LLFTGLDFLDLQSALRSLPGIKREAGDRAHSSFSLDAHTSGRPDPVVQLVSRVDDGDLRRLTLHIAGGDYYQLSLEIPHEGLVQWSLSDRLPMLAAKAPAYRVRVINIPKAGWNVTLVLRGGPVPIRVRELYLDETTSIQAATKMLPSWVTWAAQLSKIAVVAL